MLRGALDDWTVQRMLESAVRPLAEQQAHGGQRVEAVATLDHSIHWAEKMDAAAPRTIQALVVVVRASYRRALDEWRKVEHDKAFLPPLPAEMKAAEQALTPAGLDRTRVGHR
jgi:hypothetical protein